MPSAQEHGGPELQHQLLHSYQAAAQAEAQRAQRAEQAQQVGLRLCAMATITICPCPRPL